MEAARALIESELSYGLTREGAHSFTPRHRLANRPLEGLRPSWRADNVEHGLARLRSNNPQMIMPMASPPHRLGAHDRVTPFMSQRAQPSETAKETHGSTCSRLNCDNGTNGQEGAQTYSTVGRRAVTALSINQYPMVRFNRRTTRPPRYFAMSTAGISFRLT